MAATGFRSRRGLGLRKRVAAVFGFGALLLTAILGIVTFTLLRSNLLDQRGEDAIEVITSNAAQADRLLTDETDEEGARTLLGDLTTISDSVALLRLDQDWFSAAPAAFGAPTDIDPQLQALVIGTKEPAEMRYRVNDEPYLVIGVPLTKRNAFYFEATPLTDIEDTLGSLGLALLAAGLLTTISATVLAAWASRRVLRPLADVSGTAEALAGGDLSARLDVAGDADLAPLGASFNGMAEALEQRIERDERFASDVSHELRSPLMTINASVEVLNSRKSEFSDRAQTALELLSDDVERFSQLVEDLLEISRYDVGANALDLSEFGIEEFTRQAIAISGHQVPLRTSSDLSEIIIAADKRRLARVIVNLLDNADKYADGAEYVKLTQLGDSVEIAVVDGGPGVPDTEKDRIFDRFARGMEGGRRGAGTGTGLGLALVAEHVQLHTGSVRVDDRVDAPTGAAFVVRLPLGVQV